MTSAWIVWTTGVAVAFFIAFRIWQLRREVRQLDLAIAEAWVTVLAASRALREIETAGVGYGPEEPATPCARVTDDHARLSAALPPEIGTNRPIRPGSRIP